MSGFLVAVGVEVVSRHTRVAQYSSVDVCRALARLYCRWEEMVGSTKDLNPASRFCSDADTPGGMDD